MKELTSIKAPDIMSRMQKRRLLIGLSLTAISLILIGIGTLYANLKDTLTPSEFQTLKDTTTHDKSGEIAGVQIKRSTITPSVTTKPTSTQRKITLKPTVKTTQSTAKPASNPTSTPAPKQSINTAPTNTPQPTIPQATPTSIPQPTATPTPQPQLSVSISTSIDGDNVKVTAEANEPLKICIIYFLGENDIPKETKNASPEGNKCSSDNNASGIQKIKIYLASQSGLVANAEKSSPF